MVISPAFTFGLLIATFYGALAHVLLGGDGRRLLALVIASWIGFAIGQGLGQIMGINALAVGPIRVLAASLGSFIATATTAFLWITRKPPSQSP